MVAAVAAAAAAPVVVAVVAAAVAAPVVVAAVAAAPAVVATAAVAMLPGAVTGADIDCRYGPSKSNVSVMKISKTIKEKKTYRGLERQMHLESPVCFFSSFILLLIFITDTLLLLGP